MISIPIKTANGADLPDIATDGASGLDLPAYLDDDVVLEPGTITLIPTGLQMAIPDGYEAQVRPRSGLAFKYGVTVLNTPGTIDSDYRGDVGVLLVNHGDEPFVVEDGMRIAQLVVAQSQPVVWRTTNTLDETERGDDGFGSTGA